MAVMGLTGSRDGSFRDRSLVVEPAAPAEDAPPDAVLIGASAAGSSRR